MQLTSAELIDVCKRRGTQISMDDKVRWRDNVFAKRLWRSVKYEEVHAHTYQSVSAVKTGITRT